MTKWYAIGYGALDLRGLGDAYPGVEIAVLPTIPSHPHGLALGNADLWMRLLDGGLDDVRLGPAERERLHQFAKAGIADTDPRHPHRMYEIAEPWLQSPLHELVYALVAGIAKDSQIDVVFIKGPILFKQGLRIRSHSGDVDVWVDSRKLADIDIALRDWDWVLQPDVWRGTPVNHSVTYEPTAWGCEIDVHRHFPGVGISEHEAFRQLLRETTTVKFASVTVSVPNLGAQSVLYALHVLRPNIGQCTSLAEQEEAVRALRLGGQSALRIATQLGALPALAEVIARAHPGAPIEVSGDLPLNWRWRQQPNRIRAYAVAMRQAPIHSWPAIGFRLVWPSRAVADASNKRVQGGTATSGAVRARLRRLARGARGWIRGWRRR